uniref:Serine aminopeptidase S33 domain-containing protein n=1 Tax=Attheya septentrionalis TaxID=420275 RepID=A0A7S2XJZ6_9STRA|mmetsp:Transcript_14589/g.26459  ORF Transcript_14589/g.26459 Transcript_14589/m.26459 type:complete len:350 (+) Transcript_14589:144-1193(+)
MLRGMKDCFATTDGVDDSGNRTTKKLHDHLAFGGAEGLVSSNYRLPFRTKDGKTTLNVECFGSDHAGGDDDDSDWPILLFVPGICESAETWSVQYLAVAAREHRWRLFVLELEGHGLSTGKRAVCGNFSRLRGHISEFIQHVISTEGNEGVKFAVCGTSLGGILSAYGVEDFVTASKRSEDGCKGFIGAALIAPAVGIAPEAIPPAPIVGALRLMSAVAPSMGFMTPLEDPTHYACPSNSTRNCRGHWPLSTSRMLLDVTSKTVKNDQAAGRLVLDDVPSILVFSGTKDEVVPHNSVKDFFHNLKTKDKRLIEVSDGDHGIMFDKEKGSIVIKDIFKWLGECSVKLEPC